MTKWLLSVWLWLLPPKRQTVPKVRRVYFHTQEAVNAWYRIRKDAYQAYYKDYFSETTHQYVELSTLNH